MSMGTGAFEIRSARVQFRSEGGLVFLREMNNGLVWCSLCVDRQEEDLPTVPFYPGGYLSIALASAAPSPGEFEMVESWSAEASRDIVCPSSVSACSHYTFYKN
jgi:hypothetical protein